MVAGVALATFLAAGGGGVAQSATGPGANGRIVFMRDADFGPADLYSVNPNGTDRQPVTTDFGTEATPRYSPDGTKIAFQSDRNGNWELYVANADGTDETRVTTNTFNDTLPSWSPDGTGLYFLSQRGSTNNDIYRIGVDGTGETQITTTPGVNEGRPSLSPGGDRLLFEAANDIYVADADGTNAVNVTPGTPSIDSYASWSPDASQIVFVSSRWSVSSSEIDVATMDADGANVTQLTRGAGAGGYRWWDADPSWSPDGTQIVFVSNRVDSSQFDLFTMPTTGETGDAVNISNTNGGIMEQFPDWQPLAPDNDDWADAVFLDVDTGSVNGANVLATVEPGEPVDLVDGVRTGKTVWWRWVAPSAGTFTFDTNGSDFDTTLGVFTGSSVSSLEEVASDDDSGDDAQSLVTFHADADTNYYVQVGSFDGEEEGLVRLSWVENVVPNDAFADATVLEGDDGEIGGSNVGATLEEFEPDQTGGDIDNTVWYAWTPTATGPASFVVEAGFDAAVAVYTGDGLATLVDVADGSDSSVLELLFDAEADTTYYIQVGTYFDTPGSFLLSWDLAVPPENDELAAASSVSDLDGTVEGRTHDATIDEGEPTLVDVGGSFRTGENSVWYRWQPLANGEVVVSVSAHDDGAVHEPLLQLYEGPTDEPTFDSLTVVGTHDSRATLRHGVDGETTYYIQVMSDVGSEADPNFDFTLSWAPPAPDNDDWVDAAALPGAASGSASGSNVGATEEPGEPLALAAATTAKTVWWKWVAPSTDPYRFDTNGSDFDTVLGVFTGSSVSSLSEITSDDDAGDGFDSRVSFQATGGTTYYLQVGSSHGTLEGPIHLNWSLLAVPGAPTLNSATVGNGSAALAWSAPASDGGSAITGYKVYRGTSSGGETLLTMVGTVTGYTDATAVNGTTYYYKVSAVNGVGEGGLSSELSAMPATVPGAPTLNSATAGNGSVALAWSAPASDGGSAITGYKVYRGTSSGGETLLTTVGTVTGYTDATAVNGTTYYYQVSAVNSAGEGARSNERSATPSVPPNDDRDITGRVLAANGSIAPAARVRACRGDVCADTTSNSDGSYGFFDLVPGAYVVRALPDDPALLAVQVDADVSLQSVQGLDLRLATSGASSTDAGPSAFRVNGCVGGSLHYVVTGDGASLGSGDVTDGAGGTAVDGVYTIDVTPLNVGHPSTLRLDITIACGTAPTETQTALLFTDPSGTVVDDLAGGAALAGATVTLLDASGTAIPAGDPRLSPATASNPETSDAHGAWAWDVASGTYTVRAQKTNCGTTTSGPLVVTPANPVTGVVLHLSCSTPAAPVTPPPSFPPATPPPPPTLPDPVAGVNFNVVPISGTVLVNGAPLPVGAQIPFGAIIDATNGIVSITTIGPTGEVQTAYFFGGVFQLLLAPDGVTDLVMRQGDFSVCAVATVTKKAKVKGPNKRHVQRAQTLKAAKAKTVVRSLWGTGKGSFRTTGRYSSATVRGTLWYTADRCDGTYTQVNEGTVTVIDLARKKTLLVRAGHSVLVRSKNG